MTSKVEYCPQCHREAVPIYGTGGKAWMCWECNVGWCVKAKETGLHAKKEGKSTEAA